MGKPRLTIAILCLSLLFKASIVFSLEKATHQAINEKIAGMTFNGFSLDAFLKNNIGFKDGIIAKVNGQEIYKWIKDGGKTEDEPAYTRSRNHFHDPLKPWEQAGLNSLLFTGESSALWIKTQEYRRYTDLGGDWSWEKARQFYYAALTGNSSSLKGFKVEESLFNSTTVADKLNMPAAERNRFFAWTLRAVGQTMHLVEDASVPAHTRNDAHMSDGYENYVDNLRSANNARFNTLFSSSVRFTGSINTISSFIDTDQYARNNLDVTFGATIGLAEYSNANFFSDDTIFVDYLHPAYGDTNYLDAINHPEQVDAEDGKFDNRVYIRKTVGEADPQVKANARLASFSYISYDCIKKGKYDFSPFVLDENVFNDYAALLIPRAVGYSAGLLNYFFRGDIRLSYETSGTPGYVITNNTGEKMEGDFTVYYDNGKDERFPLWAGQGVMEAKLGDKSNTFDFIPPIDAKEPGKYILVFKGKMGNEEGAVAGYVFTRRLEITPPDQFVYSMIAGNAEPKQFTEIQAKVKNTSDEVFGNGTLQAVVKYKKTVDDPQFFYAISAPIAVGSLIETKAKFDFSGSPIPVDATDLYLQVIFKGKIGTEDGAVAIGGKDISEPTPIGIFNNMDRVCINGNWYVTGSSAAHDALPASVDWDYWPHDLNDVYIKISPVSAPSDASESNNTWSTSKIAPGVLYQMFILSDYDFVVSDFGYMAGTVDNDYFNHRDAIKKARKQAAAVRNQTDYSNDQALCGESTPCPVTHRPSYYDFRGVKMWGSGSFIVDGLTYPNYIDPGYIPCLWDALKQ